MQPPSDLRCLARGSSPNEFRGKTLRLSWRQASRLEVCVTSPSLVVCGPVGDAATSALTTTSDLVVGGRAAASTVLSFGAATVLAPRQRLRLSLRVGCRLQPPTWQANTMHICKNRCIFVFDPIENKSKQLVCAFFSQDTAYRSYNMGGAGTVHEEAYEAFTTNNWYNDISTRDKSREGAEEAIDLSRRFQKPE